MFNYFAGAVHANGVVNAMVYLDSVAGHFNIYTREAGAGGLSIAVEGPSKAEIDFQDHKDGSCEVAYTCTEPGMLVCTQQVHVQPFGGRGGERKAW